MCRAGGNDRSIKYVSTSWSYCAETKLLNYHAHCTEIKHSPDLQRSDIFKINSS
jgi:hypothetical protein